MLKDHYEKKGRAALLDFMVVERSSESPSGERLFTMKDVAVVTPALRKSLTR